MKRFSAKYSCYFKGLRIRAQDLIQDEWSSTAGFGWESAVNSHPMITPAQWQDGSSLNSALPNIVPKKRPQFMIF